MGLHVFMGLGCQTHNGDSGIQDLNSYMPHNLICAKTASWLSVLLVFSVMPLKILQNKNQNCSIDKVRLLRKERQKLNMQRLAKIQVTAIFLMRDMWRNFLEI